MYVHMYLGWIPLIASILLLHLLCFYTRVPSHCCYVFFFYYCSNYFFSISAYTVVLLLLFLLFLCHLLVLFMVCTPPHALVGWLAVMAAGLPVACGIVESSLFSALPVVRTYTNKYINASEFIFFDKGYLMTWFSNDLRMYILYVGIWPHKNENG